MPEENPRLLGKGMDRYYDTVYERDGINHYWSNKNSSKVLNKFKSKDFNKASKSSTYYFYTLYTTFPHHLIVFANTGKL